MDRDFRRFFMGLMIVVLGSLVVAVAGAYIDVQKLKASSNYISEDLKEIKSDLKDIKKILMRSRRGH